jgi:hypothetical protein
MSPFKSELDAIWRAADRAREQDLDPTDPIFRAIQETTTAHPTLVHTPDGKPAYWIVPFVQGDFAAGFARVELDKRVTQLATFGSGDPRSWVQSTFFENPPEGFLHEIARSHPTVQTESAMFTYEDNPEHWGWRVHLPSHGEAFITPHEWHVRQDDEPDDRER